MDMVTLITIIAIGAVIAAIALFVRQRNNNADEDYDDIEDFDGYDEDDEDNLDEDSDIYYDDEGNDAEDTDEDDEYEVEELPLEAFKATVVGMDIERHQSGSSKSPKSNLAFLVEFKIQKRKNNSEVITLTVSEEIYSDIKLGENALLVVQGKRFIDFGDRYAEDAPEEDIIAAEQEKAKDNKKKK